MAGWTDHAIFWHVYPLGFTGAPVRPHDDERVLTHRLRHLESWLDYAVELGSNALLLGPLFTATSHGYDTLDHFSIDPRLGDDADFDALVAAARARGVQIVLDGVFNHVGDQHPRVASAVAEGPHSPDGALFRWDGDQMAGFEGHGTLPELNHDNPAVADFVVDVMTHWLRRGIAGWRLDAAYTVPTGFWATVVDRVRAEFPDAWFLGEVIHGDYPSYVQQGHLDSVTQYELWKATWSSLKDGNFFELAHAFERHNEFLEVFVPQTFVGNHDVDRLCSVVGPDLAALAVVTLFTTGGIPSVYYGDEQGFTGTKQTGFSTDDDLRPMFPATPADLSPLGAPLLRLHQDLIGLRRRHPWLVSARTEQVALANRTFTYEAVGRGGERLRVELGLDPTPRARVTSGGSEEFRFIAG